VVDLEDMPASEEYFRIRFDRPGRPEDVARCEWLAGPPEPGAGQVCVRVRHAPVNPADLNTLEGTYGKLPELPATPGNEGAGTVLAVGADVEGLVPGDPVMLASGGGAWQSWVLLPEAEVVRLPAGIDLRQAAMLKVNPPTAWVLLHGFGELPPGAWIAQNAANSGVGRAVIQLARALGVRTLNFVRRMELAGELRALGADRVYCDGVEGLAAARAEAGFVAPTLAFNAVGGDSALRLMDVLEPQGVHVTYGAMSRRSLKVPNSFLIFREIQLRGLWVTRWMERAGRDEVRAIYGKLAAMMVAGTLRLPVETAYSPERIGEALRHAQREGRDGKVLLDW